MIDGPMFTDRHLTPGRRVTLLQVEKSSRIDWFDDTQWDNVEHNIKLTIQTVVVARGIIFDPEQYNYSLWIYEKAAHYETKSFAEYFAQLRRRDAQWIRAVQAVKPDVEILHHYLMTAFNSRSGVRETPGGDTPALLRQSFWGRGFFRPLNTEC